MSKEDAEKFIARLQSDEEFRNKVTGADDDATRAKIAKDAGYNFTEEEAKAALPSAGDGDLSDEDLEAVSGGSLSGVIKSAVASATAIIAAAG